MNPDTARSQIAEALDEAEYVRVADDESTLAVWHGGTQIFIYTLPDFKNIDVKNIDDATGQPLSQDELEARMETLIENERFSQ